MTPDGEPFIRAIVDRPGDGLPRLVYADWLDERGDPRGAYLRAEAKWAEAPIHGDEEDVIRLGKGLDPVWVARVSRPPVGVCCDHVRFEKSGPRLRTDTIDRFEKKLGLRLPDEYRAFLLNTNGGEPIPSACGMAVIKQFYLFGGRPPDDLRTTVAWFRTDYLGHFYDLDGGPWWHQDYTPVASLSAGGHLLCLNAVGGVYSISNSPAYDPQNVTPLAGSLAALFGELRAD